LGDAAVIVVCWLVYVALTGSLAPSNLALGGAVSVLAWWLVPRHTRSPHLRNVPRAAWALARYVVMVLWHMVRSGFQVARIVLHPRLPVRPGIVAIPSGCRSEWATALSAHAISLSPGETVVEMDAAGTMYTHCLDATRSVLHVAEAQAMRRDLLALIIPDQAEPEGP
jgi:multicomponent Na+:H+ antiporter subunit E